MPHDVQIAGSVGDAPQSYEVPNATEIIPRAINATFTGGGGTAAFIPTVEIISDGGVVVARSPCSTTVAAGGAAEVSFYPFSDELVTTTTGYAGTVLALGSAGSLRGYWRLGEAASPFADSSGYVGGPTPMNVHTTGTPYTTHVVGVLPSIQDDGALQFNQPNQPGYFLNGFTNPFIPNLNTHFTVVAWVKPSANAGTWFGGVFENATVVAGSPSHTEGWWLSADWAGGTVTADASRAIGGTILSATWPIAVGSWSMLMMTYDGNNLRLYVNAVLVATTADARGDTAALYGNPTIGNLNILPFATSGQFYGVVDEVALWSDVLTLADAETLYAAAVP